VTQTFQWQAEPVGNDTDTAAGSLNLLFGQGTAKPAETGFYIASNGQINFATGQTFPGVGTVTSVGSVVLDGSIRKPTNGAQTRPTRLTQRRRTEGRGREFFLELKPVSHPSNICPGCGATTRYARHCPKCGREISREKLIELAKIGRAAAQSNESRKKVSETQRRHAAEKRAWNACPKPAWPDEQAYVREIQPRLAAVTIARLSSALGVSESYAADIRAGRRQPHPRHWEALVQLCGLHPGR
jgi:hypothetical protein